MITKTFSRFWDSNLTMKMKALRSSEVSGTSQLARQYYTLQDLQLYSVGFLIVLEQGEYIYKMHISQNTQSYKLQFSCD